MRSILCICYQGLFLVINHNPGVPQCTVVQAENSQYMPQVPGTGCHPNTLLNHGDAAMFRTLATVILFTAWSACALSDPYSRAVSINGEQLSGAQVAALEAELGMAIPDGNYLVDPENGCWADLTNGTSGCVSDDAGYAGDYEYADDYGDAGGGEYVGRWGSGSYDGAGNWNHYSSAAGGAVGGTSDGCIYTTFGWSNC